MEKVMIALWLVSILLLQFNDLSKRDRMLSNIMEAALKILKEQPSARPNIL
jgi:hypothetical protein